MAELFAAADEPQRRLAATGGDVLAGVALDGFGIHARLDPASGNLTHPALDACNGAYVDGTYRYYLAPTRPYVPRCLKGRDVAAATRTPLPFVCPKRGRNVTYSLDATLEPLACPAPREKRGPRFVFREAPEGGGSWTTHERGFAAAFGLLAVLALAAAVRMRLEGLWPGLPSYAGAQVALVFVLGIVRACELGGDPYWRRRRTSALVHGAAWGVAYPAMDVVLLLELWRAAELAKAVRPEVFAAVPASLATTLGPASRLSALCDFGIQFMADYFRSRGRPWTWLKVCQIYYVVLGLATCAGLLYVAWCLSGGVRNLRHLDVVNVFLFRLRTKIAYVCGADVPRTRRGGAAAATWIFRGGGLPRPRRGYSAETGRGDAAAATWIFRGDGSRPRRGRDADIPWRRAHASGTWDLSAPRSAPRP